MSVADLLARARRDLDAARLLADSGFAAQAVSRAYYAAFYGAEAALLQLGETRSKHSGVIAAFAQLVATGDRAGAQAGRLLRSLFGRRSVADCSTDDVPDAEAEAAVRDAVTVLDAIETWLRR